MSNISTTNDSLRGSFSNFFNQPRRIGMLEREIVYADLAFFQANASRKALNKAKKLRFVCSNEAIAERFNSQIFHADVISQILETYLFGLNVFELNWHFKKGFYYPELVQRDTSDFSLKDGELYFTARWGEPIDARKVVYALHEPNFFHPAGEALLYKLYQIIKLKNKTIENWANYQEKFSTPWTVAKTTANPDELADELAAMRSGDVAVVDSEESIELIQPAGKSADFGELVGFLDKAIRSVILGANLAGEVEGGSFAAAEVHDKVRKDMASADLANLLFVANKTCERFCEVNHFQGELYCELEPESDIKTELAQRDAIIAQMGFDLSPDYIRETYGVEVSPRAAAAQMAFSRQTPAPSENPLFSQISQPQPNAAKPARDAIDEALESEEFEALAKEIESAYAREFEALIKNAKSYEEAAELAANAELENPALDASMKNALEHATVQGTSDALA